MKRIHTDVRTVYVRALSTYQEEQVEAVLVPLFGALLADNGIEPASLAGKKVLIKPNLLAKREASAGITTHPSFVRAACRYFVSLGADVLVCDSPGGVYNPQTLEGIYQTTGLKAAVEGTGASLNFDTAFQTAFDPEISHNSFTVLTPIAGADLIVNLNRLKTHALCEISASVKNLFGAIPGLKKAEQHARFPAKEDFADMLCDLCLLCAPQINITDGVVGMEGNGPAGGTLKEVGAVIASANPFASDLVCAHIMGYRPDEVGTVRCAVRRGLCPASLAELTLDGEAPERFASAFKRPDASAGGLMKQIPVMFGGRLRSFLQARPTVDTEKCVGCGECARNCPVSTIRVEGGKAHINHKNCIRCYCCQEFCPAKAIKVKSRFFFGF